MPFNDWLKVKFGDEEIDQRTRAGLYNDWMFKDYEEESDILEGNNDKLEESPVAPTYQQVCNVGTSEGHFNIYDSQYSTNLEERKIEAWAKMEDAKGQYAEPRKEFEQLECEYKHRMGEQSDMLNEIWENVKMYIVIIANLGTIVNLRKSKEEGVRS